MFVYKGWKFSIEKNVASHGLVVRFVTPTGSPGTFSSLCFRTGDQARLFMHRYIDQLESTAKPPANLSALLDGETLLPIALEPEPQSKPEQRKSGANAAEFVRFCKDLGMPLQKWWLSRTSTSAGEDRMSRTLLSDSND